MWTTALLCHRTRLAVAKHIDLVHGNSYDLCMGTPHERLSEAAKSHTIIRHVCPECRRPFMGIKIRLYDTRACQVRAYRRRKKCALEADQ